MRRCFGKTYRCRGIPLSRILETDSFGNPGENGDPLIPAEVFQLARGNSKIFWQRFHCLLS
jgi:hypothetical protein